MATNSSAEFPYPPTVPLSPRSYSRAASLLNLSNLFHVGRSATSRLSNNRSAPQIPNNPSTSSQEYLIGSVNTNQLPVSEREETSRWARNMKNTFSKWVQELGNRGGTPHVLLDNEEDASTTGTREDLESDLARNRQVWADNTGYDSQSASGNSLITVLSATNAVAVDIEPSDPKLPSPASASRLDVVVFAENSPVESLAPEAP